MKSNAGKLRIRNQRYRPYWTILQAMLIVMMMLAVLAQLIVRPTDKFLLYLLIAGYASLGALITFAFGLRAVLRKQFGDTAGRAPLVPFGWVVSRLSPVRQLKLGEMVEIETGLLDFGFSTQALTSIRFSPDPAEDYADSVVPMRMCQAAVEIGSGRRFSLIVDESDAQRLREWAVANKIRVCDSDGYHSRTAEPAVRS